MALRSAEAHYVQQAALAALVARRATQLWAQVPVDSIDAWGRLAPQMASTVAAAQYRAAGAAEAYVAAALAEQDVQVSRQATVLPASFVGYAGDGRPLTTLLDEPRISALADIKNGASPEYALERAGHQLQMLAVTQVQDIGRQADSVAILSRPKVGWVRMVNPPCCQRCAILAGKWFRSNAGFPRHPRCDCRAIPAMEDASGDIGTDPKALFGSGQVKGLRPGEAQAIADGADINQVVNSRRASSGMTTSEGTTRRGFAGKRLQRTGDTTTARLTPDGIYRIAPDRDAALALLKQHGYIV